MKAAAVPLGISPYHEDDLTEREYQVKKGDPAVHKMLGSTHPHHLKGEAGNGQITEIWLSISRDFSLALSSLLTAR